MTIDEMKAEALRRWAKHYDSGNGVLEITTKVEAWVHSERVFGGEVIGQLGRGATEQEALEDLLKWLRE